MTVVEIVDQVTAWAQKEICDKVRLKMPPENDKDSDSTGYEYTMVTPIAFSLSSHPKKTAAGCFVAHTVPLCADSGGGGQPDRQKRQNHVGILPFHMESRHPWAGYPVPR